MLRKQLGLIVAMLLPVVVLLAGSLATRVRADLIQDLDWAMVWETASPEDCGLDYGDTFANSSGGRGEAHPAYDYCPGDVLYATYETTYFESPWWTPESQRIHWHREQIWDFAVSQNWGNQCNVTLEQDIDYVSFNRGMSADDANKDFAHGYWDGSEYRVRMVVGGNNRVDGTSNTVRWFQKVVNSVRYRCPKYRLYRSTTGLRYYDCDAGRTVEAGYYLYDYYDPTGPPANSMYFPGTVLYSVQGQSYTYYNCIPWVM